MTRPLRIELTPRAFDDLAQIRDYLIARSPQGADNVRRAIYATLEQLQHFPMTGRERPELGVRAIGVARYAYTIYHRVHDAHVEIVHVRDDRRIALEPGDV
jgi:plasmid stabilization system protein ParE